MKKKIKIIKTIKNFKISLINHREASSRKKFYSRNINWENHNWKRLERVKILASFTHICMMNFLEAMERAKKFETKNALRKWKRAFHAFTRKRVLGREKEWKQCRRSDDNHLRWCLLKEREHNSFMKIKNYLSFFLSPCCFPLRRHIQIEHFAALSLLVVSCHFFHYHFSFTRSRCHFHLFLPQISIFSLLFFLCCHFLVTGASGCKERAKNEWKKNSNKKENYENYFMAMISAFTVFTSSCRRDWI